MAKVSQKPYPAQSTGTDVPLEDCPVLAEVPLGRAGGGSSSQDTKKGELLLQEVRCTPPIKNDIDLQKSDVNAMVSHNTSFTNILDAYEKNASASLRQKRTFKNVFFYGVCFVLVLVAFLSAAVIIVGLAGMISIENIGVYFTALGTFLTSFIVLPKVIVEYLFHPEEEKGMTDIVKAIQEYDTKIRNNGR